MSFTYRGLSVLLAGDLIYRSLTLTSMCFSALKHIILTKDWLDTCPIDTVSCSVVYHVAVVILLICILDMIRLLIKQQRPGLRVRVEAELEEWAEMLQKLHGTFLGVRYILSRRSFPANVQSGERSGGPEQPHLVNNSADGNEKVVRENGKSKILRVGKALPSIGVGSSAEGGSNSWPQMLNYCCRHSMARAYKLSDGQRGRLGEIKKVCLCAGTYSDRDLWPTSFILSVCPRGNETRGDRQSTLR